MAGSPTRRGRWAAVVALGAAALGLVGLGVFLTAQGLPNADSWASVLGLFANITGIALTAAGLRVALAGRPPDTGDLARKLDITPARQGDPQHVGRFTIVGRLAEGTTGVVFLGVDHTGEFAAVKVMRDGLARSDNDFRERFKREIDDVRLVERTDRGRSFPALLAAGADDEQPWLATAFLPGLRLDEAIRLGGPWSAPTLGWFAHGMARALQVLADNRIVHRDVKPGNVVLDEDGPRLIDLGIAKAASDTTVTRVGDLVGTMAFMAPEQLDGRATHATDVFALGLLLLYAANGRPPISGATRQEVMAHVSKVDVDWGVVTGDHPLAELVRRCLAADPARRPDTAEIIRQCAPYATPAADVLPPVLRDRLRSRSQAVREAEAERAPADTHPLRDLLPRSRRAVALLAAAVLLAVAVPLTADLLTREGPPLEASPDSPAAALPACPADSAGATLLVGSSVDKFEKLRQIAEGYGARVGEGECVRVLVEEMNSGEVMEALGRGWHEADGPRPHVWSPSSSMWLDLARERAARTAQPAVPPAQHRGAIVRSALVVAMPEDVARGLGWPTATDIGWTRLAELAADTRGGPRERFKLGKTNPNYSISGLGASYAAFHAYAGRGDTQLTRSDVDGNTGVRGRFEALERSIAHYGETTMDFLGSLEAKGREAARSYISAIAMDESAMLAYNDGYPHGVPVRGEQKRSTPPSTKLVAVYPSEGTIALDHPYVEVDPDGMAPELRAVAADFFRHLRADAQQRAFQEVGFRDFDNRPGPLADQAHGIGPGTEPRMLPHPSAEVLESVLTAWKALRKPVNARLVVDVSGSMGEGVFRSVPVDQDCTEELKRMDPPTTTCPTKLQVVQKYRHAIVGGFTPRDRIGLWAFAERPVQRMAAAPMGEAEKDALKQAIHDLGAQGDTKLYDVVDAVVRDVREQYDPNFVNAVVVLSDGEDRGSATSLDALLERIDPHCEKSTGQRAVVAGDPAPEQVRVFTIAYGADPDKSDPHQQALRDVAECSGAAAYRVDRSGRFGGDLVKAIVSNF